jgi:hypothetical protein
MILRVLIFSTIVFGSMWQINKWMTKLVDERKAIKSGKEVVMSEKDKINAIGGSWLLKDLNGKDFGS